MTHNSYMYFRLNVPEHVRQLTVSELEKFWNIIPTVQNQKLNLKIVKVKYPVPFPPPKSNQVDGPNAKKTKVTLRSIIQYN